MCLYSQVFQQGLFMNLAADIVKRKVNGVKRRAIKIKLSTIMQQVYVHCKYNIHSSRNVGCCETETFSLYIQFHYIFENDNVSHFFLTQRFEAWSVGIDRQRVDYEKLSWVHVANTLLTYRNYNLICAIVIYRLKRLDLRVCNRKIAKLHCSQKNC